MRIMNTPGFTAEASLGQTGRRYQRSNDKASQSASEQNRISPQLPIGKVLAPGFSCSPDACYCYGFDDCNDLYNTGLCRTRRCHYDGI